MARMANGDSYIIYISDNRKRVEDLHIPMLQLKSLHPEWYWDVFTGEVMKDCRIPPLYHDSGYWATIITHNNGDYDRPQTYEIHYI